MSKVKNYYSDDYGNFPSIHDCLDDDEIEKLMNDDESDLLFDEFKKEYDIERINKSRDMVNSLPWELS